MLSDQTEGYSAVARGFDKTHIICKESASASFARYHDSLGPVNFQKLSVRQSLNGRGAGLARCGEGPTEKEPGLGAWRRRGRSRGSRRTHSAARLDIVGQLVEF